MIPWRPTGPRRAGVLLHPTSLPGSRRLGALGEAAFGFLDFMRRAGLRVWQMLPLGPVHEDRSPYRSLSLDAGGEHLICLYQLGDAAWWPGRPPAGMSRHRILATVAHRFIEQADADERESCRSFIERQRDWLEPYCAFRVLRRRYRGLSWQQWPPVWRDGADDAVARLTRCAAGELQRERVVQFLFDRQWRALHRAASTCGIALFGDVPFYPALDSVDVWRHRHLFQLDARGWPLATAGVPPDAFAPEGQAWGAPVYDWARMAEDGFAWWRARLRVQGARFDLLRLDHFRGFEAYWSIPSGAAAAQGSWQQGPAAALFDALAAEPGLPALVAEDLGTITPTVEALRRAFALPGTRVLQFAFDGNPANPHLPCNHEADAVAYTGTHDNDTLAGWWSHAPPAQRDRVASMLGLSLRSCNPQRLIEALLASPAALAILPMQDVLGLDSDARMNVPGRALGNWQWRLRRAASIAGRADPLRAMLSASGRLQHRS